MNVLFLAAAPDAPRVEHNRFPVWLAEHRGTSPLERLTASLGIHEANYLIYCFLEADIKEFHLREAVSAMTPRHNIIAIRNATQGAACTALLAADDIDNETELFIVSLNEYLDVDLTAAAAEFRSRNLDAATLVFRSIHPRYSFVRLDANNFVVEAAQGRPITDIATAGAFWFRRGKDFIDSAKSMIRKQDDIGGVYYICPALNQLILKGAKIGVRWMASNIYHPLKTEAQVHNFEHDI